MGMHYDFLEIGCCDFDLLRVEPGTTGIRIEPVLRYFAKLPKEPDVVRLRCAIGPEAGIDYMFMAAQDATYPPWMKGCNSLGKPHPEHLRFGVGIISEPVAVLTVEMLFTIFDVESVGFVKVDCEGMDEWIVSELIKYNVGKIQYEHKYFKGKVIPAGWSGTPVDASNLLIERV